MTAKASAKQFPLAFFLTEVIIGKFHPEEYHPICVMPKNVSANHGGMSFANLTFNPDYDYDLTPHLLGSSGIVLEAANGSSNGSMSSSDLFEKIWNPSTVPILLAVPLLLLSSFRNTSIFAKMTFLGTMNIAFLTGLVSYNAFKWGLNVDLWTPTSPEYVPLYSPSFFCLSGPLALGLFIHNCVITIVRKNQNQENNVRDVIAGFSLVSLTYAFIGFVFYLTFPLPKACISDVSFPNAKFLATLKRHVFLKKILTINLNSKLIRFLPISFFRTC